jgi:hypothetical protein
MKRVSSGCKVLNFFVPVIITNGVLVVDVHFGRTLAEKSKGNKFTNRMDASNATYSEPNDIVTIAVFVKFHGFAFATIVEVIAPNQAVRADVVFTSLPRPKFDFTHKPSQSD